MGDEKIHPKQNKGDRTLLNILRGTAGGTGKDSVCQEAVAGAIAKGQSEGLWEHMEFLLFW